MKNFTRFALILMIGLAFLAMAAMAQVMPAQRRTLTETKMQQIAAQRLERLQEMHPERFEAMDGQSRERLYQQELHRLQRTHAQHEEKRTQRLDSLRQANESRRRLKGVTDDIPISETDSLALVALYYATNGDYWYYNDNWLTGPVNTWYGIEQWEECIEWDDIGCVAWVDRLGLQLSGNNLTGTLPEEMGDLISFHSLFFGQNELTGEIPWTIGNLSNLRELDLYYNNLTGEIPWTIGNLSNLNFLDLSYNNLSGIIPPTIGDCYYLQFFIVAYNELTYIPMEICDAFNSDWGDFYFSGNYFDLASCPAIECLAYKGVYMEEGWQNNGYDLLADCSFPPVISIGKEEDDMCYEQNWYSFDNTIALCNYYVFWSSSGTGYFDNQNILKPKYYPSVTDAQQGWVEISVEAEGCLGSGNDNMILFIYFTPTAYSGEDATILEDDNYMLEQAAAANQTTLLWTTTGDGNFSDSSILNPVYIPGQQDIQTGIIELCLHGLSDYCENAIDCMELTIFKKQEIEFQQGWSGLSSYLIPHEPEIEQLMYAIENQLIILMDHEGNYYQPSNKNIITWEFTKGYYIKMATEDTLEVTGLYPITNELLLQEGWNLIPNLHNYDIDIEVLFYSNFDKVEIITEVAGTNVYWPDKEIATLQHLKQGKSYLVKVNTPFFLSKLPEISTSEISDITLTGALAGGNIIDEGSSPVTSRGVIWNTISELNLGNYDGITYDGEGGGVFLSSITGLVSGAIYYVRAYATNHLGTAYGEVIAFAADIICGDTIFDYRDGQPYATVQVGNQCWMKENLKYLPAVVGGNTGSHTVPYYYVFGYNGTDVSAAKATPNFQTYGALYNWIAALTACPTGWHLPSDAEWTALTDYVSNQPEYLCNSNTNWIAKSLADTTNWISSTNTCAVGNNLSANNATGFSGLPGGYCYIGGFSDTGSTGFYRSSSQSSTKGSWLLSLSYHIGSVSRFSYGKSVGFSVRCLRD